MDKKPYKVIQPIGIDGRKEVGEIVHLTDEEAKQIGSEFVVPETESSSEASEAEKTEGAETGEETV